MTASCITQEAGSGAYMKKSIYGTDLSVSPICLGTMHYGDQLNEAEAARQLDSFLDKGGNFVDTAHVYGTWVPGLGSSSERYIGAWLHSTGKRNSIVLSTKGAHPSGVNKEIRRVTPQYIKEDLEDSLRLLQTDYTDLYFLHRDDVNVPVQVIIDALEKEVKAGKIRYYACSNWTVRRIIEANAYAASIGSRGFVVNQLMFSLADIAKEKLEDQTLEIMDKETYEFHKSSGMSAMAYTSLAKGYFSKRAEGKPLTTPEVYDLETNDRLFEYLKTVVSQGEYNYTDLAFLYQTGIKDFTCIPISSFRTEQQLNEGLAAMDKELPAEIIENINRIRNI